MLATWRLTRHHHGLIRAAGLEAPGHPPDLLLPPGLRLGPAAVLGGGWVPVRRGGGAEPRVSPEPGQG